MRSITDTLKAGLGVLSVLLMAPATFAQEESFIGSNIAAIRFQTDSTFDTAKLTELIKVQVGQPLSVRDLQGSIKAMHATGDFRDIQVNAERSGLDVDLTFILSINYRIGKIDFEGLSTARDRADKALQIRVADVLSLSAVDRSAIAVQTMLSRQGYLDAMVDPEVQFLREENRADIVFHVAAGELAKIGAVLFEGSIEPFTQAELIKAMDREPGEVFRRTDSRSDADRIKTYLVRRGYRRAEVRYLDETYDATTKMVTVRYRVNVGPKVRVEVAGVTRRDVRRWIPFRRSEAYSEDILDRSLDRIRTEYQRRGYFFATAEIEEKLVENEWVVTFRIDPGQKYELDEIRFEGNEKVSDKRLRKAITTSPVGGIRGIVAGLFRRPTGVTQDRLNDDRDALESFYKLEGFTVATINQPVAKPEGGKLDIIFPIVEGPQTLISEVVIEGNDTVPTKDLPKRFLEKGAPLNPQLLTTDLIALKTFYADRGNVEVQIAPRIDFTPDKTGAKVVYRIAEGPKVSIDDVVVRGNSYTEREVILRKAGLKKGEPFSYRSILEAQRDLYRLGIFQRVDLLPEQSGVALANRDVVIQVEEGKNLTVLGAVGYSTEEGARGTASVAHRNLFGTARYVGLEVRGSEKEQRYVFTYREPFIFGYDIPTQLSIFQSDEQTNPKFKISRVGTFVEATRVVREQTQWSLRYEYRIVNVRCKEPLNRQPPPTGEPEEPCVDEPQGFPIPDLPKEDQEIQISSVSPSFFWDKRDDPFDPKKGFFASSSIEYAFPLRQARAEFLKGFAQGAWYRPLTSRSFLAFSGRLGLIEPLVDAVDLDLDPLENPVPFSERFTGGGETSHRAFELNTLGIALVTVDKDGILVPVNADRNTLVCLETKGQDRAVGCNEGGKILALGGNALAILNLEYRFPIFKSLGGAFFVDAGNIWKDIGQIDFGEVRYGAGLGVRYRTPVGPIRFDVGWKLDKEPWEDPYAAFVSLGYAF